MNWCSPYPMYRAWRHLFIFIFISILPLNILISIGQYIYSIVFSFTSLKSTPLIACVISISLLRFILALFLCVDGSKSLCLSIICQVIGNFLSNVGLNIEEEEEGVQWTFTIRLKNSIYVHITASAINRNCHDRVAYMVFVLFFRTDLIPIKTVMKLEFNYCE